MTLCPSQPHSAPDAVIGRAKRYACQSKNLLISNPQPEDNPTGGFRL